MRSTALVLVGLFVLCAPAASSDDPEQAVPDRSGPERHVVATPDADLMPPTGMEPVYSNEEGLVGDEVASEPPILMAPTVGSNVRISADATVDTVSIDWDDASGNLFAVSRLTTDVWTLFLSTNGGASWAEKYAWGTIASAAVVASVEGYAYVAYVASAEGYEDVRLRRASGSTGAIDGTFGYYTIADVYPLRVEEIALTHNAEDFDNRIYLCVLLSDASVRCWWDESSDGKTPEEISPPVTNADSGLSIDYRHGYDTGVFLLLSYVGTDNTIRVYTRGSSWTGYTVATEATAANSTSVAAYDDTYMVAYRHYDGIAGFDARYRITYNAGSSWGTGTVGNASSAGNDFYLPMVSFRSRTGQAILMEFEAGTLDEYQFRERYNYGSTGWGPAVVLNDYDQNIGSRIRGDFEWMGSGWGMAYRRANGEAWFAWSRSIRYSGFETEGLEEWSNY